MRFWRGVLTLLMILFGCVGFAQPEGFGIEEVVQGNQTILGVDFLNDSTMIYWTKSGEIYPVFHGVTSGTPILDIREECAQWGDHGLLSVEQDPDFSSNGLIYLLYIVEKNYLLNYGAPNYDPNQTFNNSAVLGRVTRYQVDLSTMNSVVPGSRHILLGQTPDTGIPEMSSSHTIGDLEFGTDGTLLISCGDGNTWTEAFGGGAPYPELAFEQDALDQGLITTNQDIGAFRSQSIHSANGKILRIDPSTGHGIVSNPYYDAEEPNTIESKVWALGLRNPFRINLRPGTGVSDPSIGDPGSLFIGDVGYADREEINVSDAPGLNFGWPVYEGMKVSDDYYDVLTQDPYSPNPLYGDTNCDNPNFFFRDLITQPRSDGNHLWPNPCFPIFSVPDSMTRFIHESPRVAYGNIWSGHYCAEIPSFDVDGDLTSIDVIDAGIPGGEEMQGSACIGGDFYFGAAYPDEYFNAYFQTDYSGWARVWWFDQGNDLVKVEDFGSDLGLVIQTVFNPFDEFLYFVSIEPEVTVKRLVYDQDLRPIVSASADVYYGPSPLDVQFDASDSFDPEGGPLEYEWVFDDGGTSDEVSPTHLFLAPTSDPTQYNVLLTVTDTAGNFNSEELIISLNNTPPAVDITSIIDSTLYTIDSDSEVPLGATVTDAEHSGSELSYEWRTYLHHNTHYHLEETWTEPEGLTYISPLGCDVQGDYWYRVSLTVTDAAGLVGYDEKSMYPDCEGEGGPLPIDPVDFILYPNPSEGEVSIRGPFEDGVYLVKVHDTLGRLIHEQQYTGEDSNRVVIDLKNSRAGMFVVSIEGPSVSWTRLLMLD